MVNDEQHTKLEEWVPHIWHPTKVMMYELNEQAFKFVEHQIQLSDNGDGTATVDCSRDVTYMICGRSRDEASREYGRISHGH